MEPSEEIRQVVTRVFDALRDGDTEAVSNRLSRMHKQDARTKPLAYAVSEQRFAASS